MAGAVIGSGTSAETALGPLQSVPGDMSRQRCGFCGKRRHQVTGLAVSIGNMAGKPPGDAAICSGCLTLCREIHSGQLTWPPEPPGESPDPRRRRQSANHRPRNVNATFRRARTRPSGISSMRIVLTFQAILYLPPFHFIGLI